MVEDDVVSLGRKGLRSLRDGRFIDFVHAVRRHLGDEHLRDEGKALVEGRVGARNDQQEQEQQHEVDAPGENGLRAHEDSGGHAQPHDDAGGVDEHARAQLAANHDPFVLVDLAVQPGQIPLLLICGADFAHVLQRFLNAVGDADAGRFGALGGAAGEPAAAKEQREGHRHAPQAGDGQPPVVDKQADGDDSCGNVRAVEIAQHMAPDVLHAVDVAHERLGEVGEVALAEVTQRQFAQPLRQPQARSLDLPVHKAVGGPVLLQMRDKG